MLPSDGPTTSLSPTSGTTAAEGLLGPLAEATSPSALSRPGAGSATASPAGATPAARTESAASDQAGAGADARNSSASIRDDGTQRFEWNALNVAWVLGTLAALVLLAASPRIYDRWRTR